MIYFITSQNNLDFQTTNVEKIINYFIDKTYVYLDTETTGLDPHINKPILFIIGDENSQFVIDLRTKLKEATYILNRLKNKIFVAHNAKFDDKMLLSINIDLQNWVCTMTNSLVLYSGWKFYKGKRFSHGLDALLERHLKIKMNKDVRLYFVNKPDNIGFTKKEILYAAKDIQYLPALLERHSKLAEQNNLEYLIHPNNYNLENKFIHIISYMEYIGMNFDKEKWLQNADIVKKHIQTVSKEMDTIIKQLSVSYPKLSHRRKYNYSSTDDIYWIFEATGEIFNLPIREDLEDYMNKQKEKALKKRRKVSSITVDTKKKAEVIRYTGTLFTIPDEPIKISEKETHSLGEAQLYEYLEEYPDTVLYEFVEKLLEYREGSKMFSTYGEKFTNNLNIVTNKIHGNYNQVRTLTGRLSSYKPNMQNIPQTNKLRNCFVPEEGYSFMIIDYDRQELVILASQSKDPLLLAAINEGLDLHSHLATGSYKIIKNDPTLIVSKKENSTYRNAHKPVLFGWIYGAGANRISKTLNISKTLGYKVKERLEELLNAAKIFLDRIRNQAAKDKEIRCGSKANRRRYFEDDIEEYNLKKQAGNYRMQSTGASMVKEAMVETDIRILRELRKEFPYSCAVMQVHDEATYQLPTHLIEKIAPKIADIWVEVGNSYLDDIKITAEWEISNYWKK